MRSLFRATTSLTFGLLFVGALAGCGGATTPNGGGAPAPSPTVAVDRQAAGLMCAPVGDCGVGDIGPGGGVVFYDAGSTQPWGRYMEAAPAGWNGGSGDPKVMTCDNAPVVITAAESESIGSGLANTEAIVAVCASGAGVLAATYTGGGKTDWFLPSKAEMDELFKQRETVRGFEDGYYWSSSRNSAGSSYRMHFPIGYSYYDYKNGESGVRPIRVF